MITPTFMVIGAQKGGTTWIAKMLMQHPQIFIPSEKELHFFNKKYNYEKGIDYYSSLFSEYNGEAEIGDITPNYLWTTSNPNEIKESERTENIPEIIKGHYPNLKFIVTLRNPVRRAISAYYHHVRVGRIPPTKKISEVWDKFGILSMGYYYNHLKDWFSYYDSKKFLILVYEENIAVKKDETLKQIFSFLKVDENFLPENIEKKFNRQSGGMYIWLKYNFPNYIKTINKVLPVIHRIDFPKIKVHPEEIEELEKIYKPHNQKLSSLLNRKFPW